MDCEESRRLLDDLSEGKLAKHKVRALQEHVRGCRECLKIWSRLKTTPGTGTPPGAKWEDLSGRTIAGHAIHEVAGRGGQATVYRATQMSMNREVALKVLSGELACDSEYVQRFAREARLAASLDHPNLIRCFDAGEEDGTYYFSMDFIRGGTVARMVKEKGTYEPGEAVDIVLQVARALQYAHDKGMVHRDVKPENLMIDAEGHVKLADMGLAKKITGKSSEGGLTATGQAMGTPYYMSPEQVTEARDVDFRSDIYSLGATLYTMVTGKPPYKGHTAAAIMANVVYGKLVFPRAANLPGPLVRVIRNMMQKEPAKRYSSMERVIESLNGLLETGFRERRARWEEAGAPAAAAKDKKPLIIGAAAVGVVLIIILAVALSGDGPQESARTAGGRGPAAEPQVPPFEPTGPDTGRAQPVEPGWPPEREERETQREPVFSRAREEFRQAIEFDTKHPDSNYSDRMDLFARVFQGYPDSQVAQHAREKHAKLKEHVEEAAKAAIAAARGEENFAGKIAKLREFLEKYEGTAPVDRVQGVLDATTEALARKFETDMARSADLAAQKKFDEAQGVLDSVVGYATAELSKKVRLKKEELAAQKNRAQEEEASLRSEKAYAQLVGEVFPHAAACRFDKALQACGAWSAGHRDSIPEMVEGERRDLKLMLEMEKRLLAKLSELARKKERIELEGRDGEQLKGRLEDAGGTFVMDRKYVIDMKKLSCGQLMELAGSTGRLERLKEEMLLLACAGDRRGAYNAYRNACTGGLAKDEIERYETKLRILSHLTGAEAAERMAGTPGETAQAAEKTEPETKEKIFNGRNLNGFKASQNVFKVQKKHVYASHTGNDTPAFLLWEKPVSGDFVFSVKVIIEARHGKNTQMTGAAPIGVGVVIGVQGSPADAVTLWTEAVYGERGWLGITGGRFGSSTMRDAGRDWIELRVEVKSKWLKAFFNGEEIESDSHNSYKGGKVGVYVRQCNARFKDFTLHEDKPTPRDEPIEEAPEPVAATEKVNPRDEPVAKRILAKLALIAPEGFVAVPAGEFPMGAEPGPGIRNDEMPQHKVYVNAFFIKKFEVTQKEYKPFIDETGTTVPGTRPPNDTRSPDCPWEWHNGTYPPGKENCPLVAASWSECAGFCKWLSSKTERTYRLPTEAEWEKAASWNFVTGEKYKYPWGNTAPKYDWLKERPLSGGGAPVGSNPHDISFCGCYDMLSNVGEYCLDVYENDYYRKSPYKNPKGPKWPPDDKDFHTYRGNSRKGLTGRSSGGKAKDWRPWHDGFRVALEPTEKEKLLIQKIVESKGEFNVETYLQKQKEEKFANYHKHLFKGKTVRKKDVLKISYTFQKPEQLEDWVFAHEIMKPHEVVREPGIWDIPQGARSFAGGGKILAQSKAVFTGDATFDVQLSMRSVKNLVLFVASADRADASTACFAIDKNESTFASDYVKGNLAKGLTNLIFKLDEGRYKQFLLSCRDKELTLKDGTANCSGSLVVAVQVTDSSVLNRVKARNLNIGGTPTGPALKQKLKSRKKYSFKVEVKEGFVLFYLGREFLGFTFAPKGRFRFGIGAYNSFVDIKKVDISGTIDKDWLKKEVEK